MILQVIYGIYLWRHVRLKTIKAITHLSYLNDQWQISCHGSLMNAELLSDSYASRLFMVLKWKPILKSGKGNVLISVILPDSIGENKYRTLLAFLRN